MTCNDVWAEVYRPQRLDDVVGQPLIINKLKQVISTGNFTNLMFSGPNGNGKTTSALAIAKTFYGADNLVSNFKEINASSQKWRSINVVDKIVVPFMQTRPLDPRVPFKILLLEEADSLTPDAQRALRRPIEKYNNLTRIIMTVNYPDNLIDAIKSRFTRFDFEPINQESLVNRLKYISSMEGIRFSDAQYNKICEIVDGDLRKAVNLLQSMQVDTSDLSGVFRR